MQQVWLPTGGTAGGAAGGAAVSCRLGSGELQIGLQVEQQ